MTIDEITEILNLLGKTDISRWSISDQLLLASAMEEFAQKVEPILKRTVLRELSNNPENVSSFIMKL